MNEEVIQSIVEDIYKELKLPPLTRNDISISVSARHCHLSKENVEVLFGKGYELTKKSDLSQPGQYAANETVTLIGPRGSIHSVRILGPVRSHAQVEVSRTDGVKLGVNPPLRESGDIQGSAPIMLLGTKGTLYLDEGLIIAKTHIHMHPKEAKSMQVSNGDFVKVTVQNDRPITFEKVLIRVSIDYITDMHIDTDEANAGLLTTGQYGKVYKVEEICK